MLIGEFDLANLNVLEERGLRNLVQLLDISDIEFVDWRLSRQNLVKHLIFAEEHRILG